MRAHVTGRKNMHQSTLHKCTFENLKTDMNRCQVRCEPDPEPAPPVAGPVATGVSAETETGCWSGGDRRYEPEFPVVAPVVTDWATGNRESPHIGLRFACLSQKS